MTNARMGGACYGRIRSESRKPRTMSRPSARGASMNAAPPESVQRRPPQGLAAVHDQPVGRVVGRDRNGHVVAGDHFDVETAQAATDAGNNRAPFISGDAKVTARHDFGNGTWNL